MFLVIKGELGIEFRDGIRRLRAGEMIVVTKGTEHRPFAEHECHILIMDREGEPNTGINPSERTRAQLDEI
jgi:mannose-6-phosphate isomerase-like protein (cupin superfamily)